MGEGLPLEPSGSNPVDRGKIGEKKKRKKRKEKKREKKRRGVRSSTFSLDFTEIGPSVFVGARGKVQPRDKSFTWIRESGVFAKLREVGVFLLLGFILGLRAIQMARGFWGREWPCGSVPKFWD